MTDFLAKPQAEIEAICLRTEVLRQRNLWRRHCSRSVYRSPPLAQEQKRRASTISFDDTPRERLAAAWNDATERDRRDLIARALGKVAA